MALPEVFRERNDANERKEKKEMKKIANRICEALKYAEVVDGQYQFSEDWLAKSKSYLGAIKAMDGQDISQEAAISLVAALERWLGQPKSEGRDPHLPHVVSECSDALVALRERLDE